MANSVPQLSSSSTAELFVISRSQNAKILTDPLKKGAIDDVDLVHLVNAHLKKVRFRSSLLLT